MIPSIQEVNFPPYATLHQATVSLQEMGDRTITTQVRIDGDIAPSFDDWELRFKGERFVLPHKDPQAAKDNSTRNSLVDLTFTSWVNEELKRYFFFEPTSVSAGTVIADKYQASVNLNIEDFVPLLNQVLDYYFDGKIVASLYMPGTGRYSTERSSMEIDHTYLWDVIVKVFEVYGVRWKVAYNGTTDVYTIQFGYPADSIEDHDFEYGYQGGLLRFERQVQDADLKNILLGRGGEKNLPYRYFKLTDPQNPDWAADPDAIPELANIYFDRLRDINFRWYIRGWVKNTHRDTSHDTGYTLPDYDDNDVPADYLWAYQKGRYEDDHFNPVEYVKDDNSIAEYGDRWGALEDNDEIYPTIQGRSVSGLGRVDETVAVSEIITDDIDAAAQNAAIERSIAPMTISLQNELRTQFELRSEEFTVPDGSTGQITYIPLSKATVNNEFVYYDTVNSRLVAVSTDDGTEYPFGSFPAGRYYLKLYLTIYRDTSRASSATGTFGIEGIVLTTSAMDTEAWKPTFDIWVKNIWGTTQGQNESDVEYTERVWLPILGDRAGNEAKVVFSSGMMSISQDYEFTIVSYPVPDRTKTINDVPSEWRITLRKSDAEFDATGLFIPNNSTGGKPVAGDYFFFTGIDMPFQYVEWAEEELNSAKTAQLETEAAINPTWIINLDKVRVHTLEDGEYGQTLADRLSAGATVWITDPRFTPGQRLKLYVQSITYTWNEPTESNPYLVPDIEVVLSDKVVAVEGVVSRMQNEVEAIKTSYAKTSDIEAAVRRVAEPIFLKKTGESDSSDSPTTFSSKITSKGFRQGGIGGTGWGIYRDNTDQLAEAPAPATRSLRAAAVEPQTDQEGDTVIEVDKVIVRKEMHVNSLVINQIAYVGGKEIISAAKIEVSQVIENANSYTVLFDQKQNSVANLFRVGDIAYGQRWSADESTTSYYKMVVTATDVNSITLGKTPKDGSGVPAKGDVIVQFGSTTDSARRYVIVRDVIGGGYERMLSGLNSVTSDGNEYYFAGRESGASGPRWFVGDANGEYAEWENGQLNIKGSILVRNGSTYSDLSGALSDLDYLTTALPESSTLIQGGLILSKVIALTDAQNNIKSGINGVPSLSNIAAWYGGPMADKENPEAGQSTFAQSLFRFDGSGYLAGGNIYWNSQGYGGIPGVTWSKVNNQDVVTIGANVQLQSLQGSDSSVTDLIDAVNNLADLFEIIDGNIHVKNNRGFYSDSFISAAGLSSGGGAAGGNATLVAQTYGGTLSATGISPINFYSKEKVDELLSSAGSVQTVAGVSPVSGDIPVASLKTALSLGAAAAYGIGFVENGNTGLVTGGSVYTAINSAISSVLKFVGTTTSDISDGSTLNPIIINNASYTAVTGNVVLKSNKEYLWNGSSWEELGDEASWALKTITISGTGYLTGGGSLEQNRTIDISQTAKDKIDHGETAYNWFEEVTEGGITYLKLKTASGGIQGFATDGFVSAGGVSPGGGSGGTTLDAVWTSFTTNTDSHANDKISAYHIPIGSGLQIDTSGQTPVIKAIGAVISVVGQTGAVTTTQIASALTDAGYKLTDTTYTFSNADATLSWGSRTKIATTGGTDIYVTMPSNPDTNTTYKLTLNGTTNGDSSNGVNLGSLYAPTSAGTQYYTLVANASGVPTWTAQSNITAGALTTVSKTIWGVTYWTSGGIPTNVTGRPNLYIGTTQVQTSSASQALTGISSITASGLIKTTNYVQGVRFYLDDDVYFVKDSNGVKLVGAGFYTDSFVSAGGYSPGGGTSGIDPLAMWKLLTNNNSLTTYDDNTKIHTAHLPTLSAGTGLTASYTQTSATSTTLNLGINASQIATAIGLGSYLPLSGGTISGTSNSNLIINNSGTGSSSYITFRVGGNNKAYVGFEGTVGALLQNVAVTGNPYVNIASDGDFKYKNTYKFWHEGNDGASSDLDADLLDGQHGSYYNNLLAFYDTGATSADAITYPLAMLKSGTPSTSWYYVTTMYYNSVGGNTASQIATSYNATIPQMYIRQKYSGTWSGWQTMYHSGNLTSSVIQGIVGTGIYHPYGGGNIAFSASTLTSSVATGTAPLTVASTTMVTNLNANYLNGWAQEDFVPANLYSAANGYLVKTKLNDATRHVYVKIEGTAYNYSPIYSIASLYTSHDGDTAFLYPYVEHLGRVKINNLQVFLYGGYLYIWFQQPRTYCAIKVTVWAHGVAQNYVDTITDAAIPSSGVTCLTAFTEYQGAFTDSNVASATKLATARTIWGQSFDGTGNVSGALSGATTGAFSSNVTIGGTLAVTGATSVLSTLTVRNDDVDTDHLVILNGKSAGADTGSRYATLKMRGVYSYRYSFIRTAFSQYGVATGVIFGFKSASDGAETTAAILNGSGNLTLGASDLASTSYKLYVNGGAYASSLTLPSGGLITWIDTSSNSRSLIYLSGSNSFVVGAGQLGNNNTYLYGNQIILATSSSRNNDLVIDSTGNVGIGGNVTAAGSITTSSYISATVSNGWAGVFTSTNNVAYLAHAGANSGGLYIGSKANTSSGKLVRVYYGQTSLGSGGTCALVVQADGCIGIDTDAPSQKLDVGGNIYTSGFIRLANNQNINFWNSSSSSAAQLVGFDSSNVNHFGYGGSGGVYATRIYGSGITFYNSSRTQIATITNAGNITIGASDLFPTYGVNFIVDGSAFATGILYTRNISSDNNANDTSVTTPRNIGSTSRYYGGLFCNSVYLGTNEPALVLYGTNKTRYSIYCGTSSTSGNGTHGGVTGNFAAYFTMYNTTNRGWIFQLDNGSTRTNVASISGGGTFVANGAVTAGSASDVRLKTNINTLSDEQAKALIMALRPVTFTWNKNATELYDQYQGDDLGFVAQEVEPYFPKAIGTIFTEYKRLDQTKFIAPLVRVAQNHEARIQKLEKSEEERIKELKIENARLRTENLRLKSLMVNR